MYDLAMRVKELVGEDPSRARDKDVLVRLLTKETKDLGSKDRDELFALLLAEYVNHHVRRPAGPRTSKSKAVAPAALAPAQAQLHRAQLMEQAGRRPLFIPSLVSEKNDGWVAYNDMTKELWQQYIDTRQRISRVSASLASWGSANLTALRENNAPNSGALPEPIRESLLRRMPPASGKELTGAITPPQRELSHRA